MQISLHLNACWLNIPKFWSPNPYTLVLKKSATALRVIALLWYFGPFRPSTGAVGSENRAQSQLVDRHVSIQIYPRVNYYRCGTSIWKSCVSRKWSSQGGLSKILVCRREIKWFFGELETHFAFQRTWCTDWHGRKLGWGQWMTMGASWYWDHETGMETKHDYKWQLKLKIIYLSLAFPDIWWVSKEWFTHLQWEYGIAWPYLASTSSKKNNCKGTYPICGPETRRSSTSPFFVCGAVHP